MKHLITKAVQSRLDEQRISLLQQIADGKGISLSLLIRLILIEYLEPGNESR